MNIMDLFNLAPCVLYWKNNQCIYQGCNEYMAHIAGLSSINDIIGKTDDDMPWAESAQELRKNDLDVINTAVEKVIEERCKTIDGKLITFLSAKKPVYDQSGKIIGVSGVSIDVSIYKQTEQRLLEKSQEAKQKAKNAFLNLEQIIACMPGSVFWKDKKGIYQGCNDEFASMLDLPKSEIIGKSDFDFSKIYGSPSVAKAFRKIDKEVIESGMPRFNVEEPPFHLANGKIIHQLANKVPLRNDANEVVGVIGIGIDITDRKKMEVDLHIAKEKAEASNQAKEDFISNMEHDLRTPFAGIGGVANMLYGLHGNFPKEQLLEFLEIMVKSCTQWEDIHNRIFDSIVIDKPKKIHKNTFSISQELTAVRELVLATLYLKELSCIISPIPNEIDIIETDKLKFRLIVANIVSNAINFTEKGLITINVTGEDKYCVIRITDTGIGIPEDKFDYIFERFTKLSRSNKYGGNFKGIGSGLYVSRQLVNKLGGSIQVESIVGKGSTFIVKLPRSMSQLTNTEHEG